MVDKRTEAQSGVLRAKAQIRVVIKEAGGNNNRVFNSGQMPYVLSSQSLKKTEILKRSTLN